MTNKHTTKANNQQKGQSKGAMSTGVTTPQNSSQHTGSIQGSSPGATDVFRQSLNVLYGSHIPQPQTVTPEATIMTNMSNINNSIDNNMGSPIGFPTNQAQQYIQNTKFPQQSAQFTQQNAQFPQQNYQQINQQTNGANGTQQKFNCMLQSLGQQLQSIHGQLEGQNQRWQAIESKIEKQNIRMTNMETQMGQITAYKQTLIQTATKVETLSDEMKSVHVKLREHDKSIQSYSDMCDDITASNSQTDSQIESLIQKEQCQNVLETKQSDTEEKLIDIQWRTMRENFGF